jgi:hypothetical protein
VPGGPHLTSRRTALGGLLAGLAGVSVLTACDVDDLRPPEDEDQPAPTPSTGDADPDPDQDIVDEVVALVTRTWAVVVSAGLGARLGQLQRMHEAHLEVLGATPVNKTAPASGPEEKRYQRALDRERRLQRGLATAAVEASSGALARLLASMSASVAQHLAALPAQLPTDGAEGR